jgi:diacylglycerol kinase family enzyme
MLFFGNGSSPLIWDYACEKITIESSTEIPFQIGGDLIGKRTKVEIDICQVDVIRGSIAAAPEPKGATDATV